MPVQYPRFHQEVKKGERIFLDDGNLSGVVKQVSGQRVDVEIQTAGFCLTIKELICQMPS